MSKQQEWYNGLFDIDRDLYFRIKELIAQALAQRDEEFKSWLIQRGYWIDQDKEDQFLIDMLSHLQETEGRVKKER